jgi:hypothetical protein
MSLLINELILYQVEHFSPNYRLHVHWAKKRTGLHNSQLILTFPWNVHQFNLPLMFHWDLKYNWGLCNRLAAVTVIIIASRAVDCELESRSCQTKDYKISSCCFSDKHTTLRRNRTDGLARNQNNVSEWGLSVDCCFSELVLLKCNEACWYKTDLISLQINFPSPRYSWKKYGVGVKQYSLTHYISVADQRPLRHKEVQLNLT